jgi:hypothetical protein
MSARGDRSIDMNDARWFEEALDYMLRAAVEQTATEIMGSRAAGDGIYPVTGFAAVVAWLWATAPERAIALTRSLVATTQRNPRQLPGPPVVPELLDVGLYPAIKPLIGHAAAVSLIAAAQL